MADNVLKAVIDVSAPGAVQTFKDVEDASAAVNAALKQLGQQGVLNVRSMGDALNQLKGILSKTTDPQDIAKLNIAITALQQKIKDVPPEFEKVHVSSLRASSSALNLSKSLGIIPAESSHITHALESIIHAFEQMENQEGSVQGGLKQLAGTIGSGIGLGLLVTGVSFLVEKLFETEDATERSKEAFERYEAEINNAKESVKGLVSELDFLNQLNSLRNKALNVGDVLTLQGDVLAISDLLLTLNEKRQKNLEEAKKINDDEELNDKDREKALKSNAAALKEIEKTINDESEKQRLLYQQIHIQKNEDAKKAEQQRLKDYQDYLKRQKELYDFELGLLANLEKDAQKIEADIAKSLKELKSALSGISKDINLDPLATNFGKPAQKISENLQKEIEKLTKNNPILIKANTKIELTTEQKNLIKASEQISQDIQDAFTEGFKGLGEGIGAALSGGDISEAFKGFAAAIGGAIKAIGQHLIELGTTAIAVKLALGDLFKNPFLAIAAGIALTALGTAFQKSLQGGIKGFAAGGQVQGGVPILVGEQGREVFIPDTGGRIIPNHKLAGGGVQNGGMSIRVTGTTVTRGQDLITILSLANKANNRLI